jgi:VCBS repeat-containing protein
LLVAAAALATAVPLHAQTIVAADDAYATEAGVALNVDRNDGVLENDNGGDEDEYTAVLVSTVTNGALLLDGGNGGFVYFPNLGFTGNDTFTYFVVDDETQSNVATVTITVVAGGGGNIAPVAVDDTYAGSEDTQLDVNAANGVLANDTDAEAGPLTAVLSDSVNDGALTLRADGSFSYTPPPGFVGTDQFRYRARDGSGAMSARATVRVEVNATNEAPVAAADSYSTNEGQTLSVNANNGVLNNDTDPDGGTLTAFLVGAASSGTLTLQPNGSFSLVPANGFSGTVTFTYEASDGVARSNTATVTITVNAVNDPPTAQADSYATAEDAQLNVAAAGGVLANDTDPDGNALTAVLVGPPSSGTLTLQPNGSFNFAPVAGFNGTVTFTYQADDGQLRSTTATVTITVNAVNDPPVAQPDTFSTAEDTALAVAVGDGVLANDTDPDGATTLTAALIRNVANGSLTLRPDGSFNYTPPSNFSGTTSFTYQARDGTASSATTTVTINVTAVNDAPFISNAPATTATEGVTYGYTLAASDADGDTLQITAPTLPSWLRFNGPATISGTPAQSDAGTHDVTMEVSDGVASAVVLRFQVTVQAVDNVPAIATIPQQTATEGAAFDLDLTKFVTDADTAAGGITYALTSGAPPGVTLSSTGRLSGTPQLGASVGQYTVGFTVADATNRVSGQLALTVITAGRIDLAVTLSAAPSPVPLDAVATWTIAIANRAANVGAPGVALETVFNGDVPFRFDASSTAGCTTTPSGNQTTLSCALGPLAGGATTTITLTGRGSFAGDVFGHATVATTGSARDDVPGNDRATASLSIAQRVSSSPEQRIQGFSARAVAAADFNGDGFDDLAVATASPQGLVLFPNIVDPTNSARRMLATTAQSLGGEALGNDLAVADIDRDGDLDIVVAAAAGAPDRAFLSAGGSFTATVLGAASLDSRAVTVGDVNGDAFVDIVFANPGGSSLLVNSGSGGVFVAGPRIGTGDARDVLLVDLSGDALPELVIANGDGDAAVYGNSGGVFTLARTLTTGPTSSVASGDFNADGRADVVFGRETATPPALPTTLVWLNGAANGGGLFVSDELGAATTSALLVKDFDLDGRNDVLALNTSGVRIFTNAGAANGTFVLHPQQLATPAARGAAAGKFSNDDRIDLAVVGDGVTVFSNDGKGNFGSGDSTPPTLTLRGEPTVNIIIDAPFTDPGVTATDTVDGDLTSRVVTAGTVNNTLLGSYTVTYTVTDLSGNAATPVTRTVNVQAQPAASEGGGGGAVGHLALVLLLGSWLARRRRTRTAH